MAIQNNKNQNDIDKQIRLFFNKRHESPIAKHHTGENCESLKTSESKKIFFFAIILPWQYIVAI